MSQKIQIRRGTDAQRSGVTFDSGEPVWTTDTQTLHIGDGSTPGGISVGGGSSSLTLDSSVSGLGFSYGSPTAGTLYLANVNSSGGLLSFAGLGSVTQAY